MMLKEWQLWLDLKHRPHILKSAKKIIAFSGDDSRDACFFLGIPLVIPIKPQ